MGRRSPLPTRGGRFLRYLVPLLVVVLAAEFAAALKHNSHLRALASETSQTGVSRPRPDTSSGLTPSYYSLEFSHHGHVQSEIRDFPSLAVTVSLWVKYSSKPNAGTILSYFADDHQELLIQDPHRLSVGVHQQTGRDENLVSTDVDIADNRWHAVTVTWSSESGRVVLYVDGKMRGSGKAAKGVVLRKRGTLVLGEQQEEQGGAFTSGKSFYGEMKQLAIWGDTRTPGEVSSGYDRCWSGDEGNIWLYWAFDEGEGNELEDRTGHQHNGEILRGLSDDWLPSTSIGGQDCDKPPPQRQKKRRPFVDPIGAIPESSMTTVTGAGTVKGYAGERTAFTVASRSKDNIAAIGDARKWSADITGGPDSTATATISPASTSAGELTVTYEAKYIGTYDIIVKYDGNLMATVHPQVKAADVSIESITLKGAGAAQAESDARSTFTVTAKDKFGNPACGDAAKWQSIMTGPHRAPGGEQLKGSNALTSVSDTAFRRAMIAQPVMGDVSVSLGPCEAKTGTFTASYTARVAGVYDLIMKYDGVVSQTLHPRVNPGKVSRDHLTVDGPGVVGGEAGQRTSFKVVSVDAFGNPNCGERGKWQVDFEGPSSSVQVDVGECNVMTGELHVTYTADKPGSYTSRLKYNGEVMNTMNPLINPGQPDPGLSTVSTTQGFDGLAGDVITFKIISKDRSGNPTCANSSRWNVEADGPAPMKIDVKDLECVIADGSIPVTISSTKVGTYDLKVMINGHMISNGGQFHPVIKPAKPSPTKSSLTGQTLKGLATDKNGLKLTARDDYMNPSCGDSNLWSAEIGGPSRMASVQIGGCSMGNGEMNLVYTASKSGRYDITLKYDGVAIGSAHPIVEAGPPSPGKNTAVGEAVKGGTVGTRTFNIAAKDSAGNPTCGQTAKWSVTIVGPSKSTVLVGDCNPSDFVREVTYTIEKMGPYELTLKYDNQLIDTSHLDMCAGKPSASKSRVDGQGVVSGDVGQKTCFKLTVRDEFGNPSCGDMGRWNAAMSGAAGGNCPANAPPGSPCYEALVNSPTPVSLSECNPITGSMTVTYQAFKAGQYDIVLQYEGGVIATVHPIVLPGPPDAKNSKLAGPNVNTGSAGPNTFTILAQDVAKNPTCGDVKLWSIDVFGPSKATVQAGDCAVLKGEREVQYLVTKAGNYEIKVSYSGKLIDSTHVTVTPGPVKLEATRLEGDGVFGGFPGSKTQFSIFAEDNYGNPTCGDEGKWEVEVAGAVKNAYVELGKCRCDTGEIPVVYLADKPGRYQVNVKYGGVLVKKANPTIADNSRLNANCIATGEALTGGIVGLHNHFSVTCIDIIGNPNCGDNEDWTFKFTGPHSQPLLVVGSCIAMNGTVPMSYAVTIPGIYTLTVQYRGHLVAESTTHVVDSCDADTRVGEGFGSGNCDFEWMDTQLIPNYQGLPQQLSKVNMNQKSVMRMQSWLGCKGARRGLTSMNDFDITGKRLSVDFQMSSLRCSATSNEEDFHPADGGFEVWLRSACSTEYIRMAYYGAERSPTQTVMIDSSWGAKLLRDDIVSHPKSRFVFESHGNFLFTSYLDCNRQKVSTTILDYAQGKFLKPNTCGGDAIKAISMSEGSKGKLGPCPRLPAGMQLPPTAIAMVESEESSELSATSTSLSTVKSEVMAMGTVSAEALHKAKMSARVKSLFGVSATSKAQMPSVPLRVVDSIGDQRIVPGVDFGHLHLGKFHLVLAQFKESAQEEQLVLDTIISRVRMQDSRYNPEEARVFPSTMNGEASGGGIISRGSGGVATGKPDRPPQDPQPGPSVPQAYPKGATPAGVGGNPNFGIPGQPVTGQRRREDVAAATIGGGVDGVLAEQNAAEMNGAVGGVDVGEEMVGADPAGVAVSQ